MMQVHGAAGLSQDFPLAQFYSNARVLRLADGTRYINVRYKPTYILAQGLMKCIVTPSLRSNWPNTKSTVAAQNNKFIAQLENNDFTSINTLKLASW